MKVTYEEEPRRNFVLVPTTQCQFLETAYFLKGKEFNPFTTQEVPTPRNSLDGFPTEVPGPVA